MKERPILFSAPMVRAILAGQKTQTRRIVKPQPVIEGGQFSWKTTGWSVIGPAKSAREIGRIGICTGGMMTGMPDLCPYGYPGDSEEPGDRLWVRETWRHTASTLEEARAITEDITSGTAVDWRATYIDRLMTELGFSREDAEMADDFENWRPSIHMPRWASRILLEIVSVRAEPLQDISEADCWAEGIEEVMHDFDELGQAQMAKRLGCCIDDAKPLYAQLWESINGAGSWDANPWVWVVEFKRVEVRP